MTLRFRCGQRGCECVHFSRLYRARPLRFVFVLSKKRLPASLSQGTRGGPFRGWVRAGHSSPKQLGPGGGLSEEGVSVTSRRSTEVLDLRPKRKSGDHSADLWVSSSARCSSACVRAGAMGCSCVVLGWPVVRSRLGAAICVPSSGTWAGPGALRL